MKENRSHRQGLALVGLRGTGKSSVGRILADRLGRPFADADVELEAASGRSIPSIFAELGEPCFRDWEERMLGELTTRPELILATGGGVILRESNRKRLREFGFVVWLTADPALLADRLLANPRGLAHRPALTSAGTIAELADVLQARASLYREVADLVVETGGRTTRQVVEAILDGWPDRGEQSS
ncbi:shikimate kinase [Singulisphaera acidiphila]|uniref:shikimate kinase n=1 Tax=Singulisphaera acidiphila TaxID=466153 RepID=UPI000375F5E2|nr:shikimate kinase [Singulisphaera acidiphila]